MWHDSICNTVHKSTVTSIIVAKKTTTWGELGFPSEFLVYFHKAEFELALEEVNEAVRLSEAAAYPRVQALALMNQGIIQLALGKFQDSVESSSRALEMSRKLLDQRLVGESTNTLGEGFRKLGETSKSESTDGSGWRA